MELSSKILLLCAAVVFVAIDGAPTIRRAEMKREVAEINALGSTQSTKVIKNSCSWQCERVFVHGCMKRTLKDYTKCRKALDSGTSHQLNRWGKCVPGCQDTKAMRALAPPDIPGTPCSRQSLVCIFLVAGKKYAVHMKVLGSGGKLIILQHGSGGKGQPMLNLLSSRDVQNAVLMAPDYNVGDHLAFEEIVKMAGALSFVDLDKGIAVVGYSKGCAATIQLLLHNHDRKFKQFACFASQLRPDLYHNGKFLKDGVEVDPPKFKDRRLGFFNNEGDPVIPFQGGKGVGNPLLSVPESIGIWARHYGGCDALEQMHMGTLQDGVTEISYLNGSIASYSTTAKSHGMELHRPTMKRKLIELVSLGA